MDIKELHLRNIASIEEADIDFEKGLVDGVTGDPASVFLISGDTGSGKSVILDGITMALYKTTPRISGVTNANRNEFKDAGGESIRVGSIEQYTRQGISEKDECYSELVFTGNDGVEYRARLTLGMLLGNTDKETGIRPLKHRSPKWEVKIGAEDWTKDSVADTILNAVGLTFEQFGRMAMLAQGQFASFLTGDKKEREAILEQLTNTERFTDYGKAIKSLFDKAKEDQGKIQVEFNTESQHTLPQETVDAMVKEKKTLDDTKKDLDMKIASIDNILALVTTIEKGRADADRESVAKAALEAQVAGEEYKSKASLVKDWDATSTERQRLADLKEAKRKLEAAMEKVSKQKKVFAILASDLEARREDLKTQGNPQKAVDVKQKEIDNLNSQRMALEPAKVNEDLAKLFDRKTRLSTLSEREKQIEEDLRKKTALEAEIAENEKVSILNKESLDKAQGVFSEAKAKSDEVNSRLATMSTGIEEAMVNIRKRLVTEHAEICPLCGGHIHEIPLDKEFKNILTPLEKEQKAAAEALVAAEKARDNAKTIFDKYSEALRIKKINLEKLNKDVRSAIKKLSEDAAEFGIDTGRPIPEQIASVEESLKKQEIDLKYLQDQAEELQGKIAQAQSVKRNLDQALAKFNSESQMIKNIEAWHSSVITFIQLDPYAISPKAFPCADISAEWNKLVQQASKASADAKAQSDIIKDCNAVLDEYFSSSGKTVEDLIAIGGRKAEIESARAFVKKIDEDLKSKSDAVKKAEDAIKDAIDKLGIDDENAAPKKQSILEEKDELSNYSEELVGKINVIKAQLDQNSENVKRLAGIKDRLDKADARLNKWNILNGYFGGTRFRTLVQTYILRPLLNNANIYLEQITDRYKLTCSEDNEQLSILVEDNYSKNIRSVTVLSGGERFMISLALSLALSSLNRPDMNVNILFIDEGFGTLDEKNLDSVMKTLETLQEIVGQGNRRVGIISHREELDERIPVQIQVKKRGEGRSHVVIQNSL